MNLAMLIEDSARMFAQKKAMVFNKKVYKYRSLNETINRYANLFLEKYRIQKGKHVGILLNNSPEYIILSLAVIKTGATIIPINRFLTAREIKFIVDESDMAYLISSSDFKESFQVLSSCEKLNKILSADITATGEKIDSIPTDVNCYSSENLNLKISENDPAIIIFTSGTTGYPKGAMLSHKNLISNVLSCTEAIKVTHKDNLLLALPMFHSFTFTVCILMPLAKGAAIIGLPSIKPFSLVLKSILLNRITIFICIPKVYDIISEKRIPFFLKPFIKIRLCISGSAPLSAKTLERFKKNIRLPLLEGYGLSETSPVVSVNPIFGEQKPGSVGLPVKGVKVKIFDDNQNEVQLGESGEIAVKGDNVMLGYYKKPQETSETIKNGWLLTGDIGKLDEDGYIYILDRKKDMILMQGMNIYPREIEEVILSHHCVEEAAVVGIKEENHGEIPIAFIVVKEGFKVTNRELAKFCKERLASYKCPRKYMFLDKLPRSSVGKILKKDLMDILD